MEPVSKAMWICFGMAYLAVAATIARLAPSASWGSGDRAQLTIAAAHVLTTRRTVRLRFLFTR